MHMKRESIDENGFEIRLTKIQPDLLSYIVRLTANVDDAQDLRQNVNIKLWQQRASYRTDVPLLAWAQKIAYYEILTWRKDKNREEARLCFSDEAVAAVAERLAEQHENADATARAVYLQECLNAMPPVRRAVIDAFYRDNKSLKQISGETHLSYGTVRNLIYTLRSLLRSCVEGKIKEASSR